MSSASKRSSNHGSDLEEVTVPVYGSTLAQDVRAQFDATTQDFWRREEVMHAQIDAQLQEVQNTLNDRLNDNTRQMTEGFNNLNMTLRCLEERLPTPGGANAPVLQPPLAHAHHAAHHDRGDYCWD